ncbi:MAG TPA: hypothetical protein VH351_00505 [Bryobacteraceae bacterium]|nr:hypothetical protein [Bryobacteraceae bacterium]
MVRPCSPPPVQAEANGKSNGLNFPQFNLGGLHSAYVRGEALIAAHRYAEAPSEFQNILDHRGIVGMDPIGAGALATRQSVHAIGKQCRGEECVRALPHTLEGTR